MSDINGLVTGLQGFPVSNTTPEDGYVLTWDGYSNQWLPKTIAEAGEKLKVELFTADGYWTCPKTTTNVIICGAGGGGAGGTAGGMYSTASGGGAALFSQFTINVVGEQAYFVKIGCGGVASDVVEWGGASGTNGGDGVDTLFGNDVIFYGAQGGLGCTPSVNQFPTYGGGTK